MRNKIGKIDVSTGLILACCYFAMLASTLDIGYSRDEGFYFRAAEEYSYWYDDLVADPARAFSKESVNKNFAYNSEHPALPKMMFALSWRLFGNMHDPVAEPWSKAWYHNSKPPKPILGLMAESTAMRLPALLLNSALVMFIFLFGVEFFNRRVALVSSLAWMFMPHAFWHSHLACFDMPVTAMWFLTAWLFLKATPPLEERRANRGLTWKLAVLTGIAWGLSLSTKHNAYFMPIVFLIWYLIARWREVFPYKKGFAFKNIPPAFWTMLFLGPLVLYITWPKLWFDPIGHMKFYISFHAKHEYYWAYFFGTLYTKPPFPISFPFVMSMMTIPAPLVLLGITGQLKALREWWMKRSNREYRIPALLPVKSKDTILFVFLNFLIPFAVIAAPNTPIFGGTKHWMAGVPFFALFIGLGFETVVSGVGALRRYSPRCCNKAVRAVAVAACLLAIMIPSAWDTFHGHTNGSTYYNAAFGGYGAMGKYGMQREFWGNSAFSALPWLNDNAKKNAKVDFHDTAWDSVRMYWRDGLLRKDIRAVWDYAKADYYLFHWHKEFLDLESKARSSLGNPVPVHVVEQDGVPLLNVYQRVDNKQEKRLEELKKIQAPIMPRQPLRPKLVPPKETVTGGAE